MQWTQVILILLVDIDLVLFCNKTVFTNRVFHHFFKHFLAEPNRAYNFIAISVPQIQNFRKFGPKLRLLQAKNKLKQPNTANRPILAAPQPSRAELEHPQFWSDFSEILDLRSWNTFKTAGSVWLCLKKWWNTLMDTEFLRFTYQA